MKDFSLIELKCWKTYFGVWALKSFQDVTRSESENFRFWRIFSFYVMAKN